MNFLIVCSIVSSGCNLLFFINQIIKLLVMYKKMQNRKFLSLVFCLFLSVTLKSQNYQELKIKEHYDDIYIGAYEYPPAIENFNDLATDADHASLGQWGAVLESLLIMYENTGDKAYLYKFMDYVIKIHSLRWYSYYFIYPDDPDSANINMNGRLLWPMAHFVYIIKVEKHDELYDLPICHQCLANSTTSSTTFGEFADWLSDIVKERLNKAVDDLWRGSDVAFFKNRKKDDDNIDNDDAASLNFQAPWGLTLIYMYLAEGYNGDDYGVMALQMAQLYLLHYVDLFKDPDCEDSLATSECFSLPVLRWKSNNSYWWYHSGWSVNKHYHLACIFNEPYRGRCSGYTAGKESLDYGTLDILFPLLYNKYADYFNPHLTSGLYFEDYQMVRFRNTFTKNLYAGAGNFNCAVDGTDGPIYEGDDIVTECPDNYKRTSCPAWMPLYKFDDIGDGTHTVYEIIMDYYNNYLKNSTSDEVRKYFVTIQYKGLADIVSAQWDKECPNMNLTLKNRKVVYDQDFSAQNILIVEPKAPNEYYTSNENSFADPVITEDKFIIEPGVTVNMKSGNIIILKHGFHAKEGCRFHAYIDPDLCESGGNKMLVISNNENTDENFNEIINDTTFLYKGEDNISIIMYPNPNYGNFVIALSGSNENSLSIEIANLMGSIVYKKENIQSNLLNIDISSHPKGIYFVKAFLGDKAFVEKIIYQ